MARETVSEQLIRPLVRTLQPYVPGEQPRVKGLIKLNTNENPYPPSPRVLEAVRAAVDGRLRLYPDPTAERLRDKLARLHGCDPDQILVGNGADEVLRLAVHTFVEPLAAQRGPLSRRYLVPPAPATVQSFVPSYSLYPVLAAQHGAAFNPVPLQMEFALPEAGQLKHLKQWQPQAALTIITTPNAPSGRGYATRDIENICARTRGVLLLDETYADFAPENALALALKHPHVIVCRSFSKAYSLCFLRIGYAVGPKPLIQAMHKLRDSYNVNGLAQVAAEATLDDLAYYRENFRKIIETREWTTRQLQQLGFLVLPSQTNFILTRPPGPPAGDWYAQFRQNNILVRWFDTPELSPYLRITIGTPKDMETLVRVAKRLLR
ncbi:histidinol-phosphate transaminase [Limisphaera ngatamarikiensis]|uniref:Histidinol-phosphate aminotransferase n=1 Tax=Limisphaera ngatamarikiensis TaxID=1324935 RepID=A0A6M1RP01_9BACT|nr:histidinol-phosphate transaminase [Limisphaera ngatamarikiensis]NGO39157.1 histidinol-phosphate transaminase [Limisphaera ngatamarikiensis]